MLIPAGTMTFFGLWGLVRSEDMGNDEVVSRWAAMVPLGQLPHVLRHIDAVHGLYYLILHGWMIVGNSPATIRIPSVADTPPYAPKNPRSTSYRLCGRSG